MLLCALLLVVTSTPAKAITRPENRVGGSPVLSTEFASQQSAKPIGTPSENAGYDYDFASETHKYLYAQDDPINMVDPSGRMGDLISMQLDMTLDTSLDEGLDVGVSKVQAQIYNTLVKVMLNQQKITFALQATMAGFAGLGETLNVVDRGIQRLQYNTIPIPKGNFSYGNRLEQIAFGTEKGYLGGNVKTFDYFNPQTGVAISNKAHALADGPDLSTRLLSAIRGDLENVQSSREGFFGGTTAMGDSVRYAGSQIKQSVLFVEVPEAQTQTVLESTFQAAIADYEEAYNTLVEVVPVAAFK